MAHASVTILAFLSGNMVASGILLIPALLVLVVEKPDEMVT